MTWLRLYLVLCHMLLWGSSASVYMPGEAPLHVVVLAVPVQQGALHLAHQHLGRSGTLQTSYSGVPGTEVEVPTPGRYWQYQLRRFWRAAEYLCAVPRNSDVFLGHLVAAVSQLRVARFRLGLRAGGQEQVQEVLQEVRRWLGGKEVVDCQSLNTTQDYR